MTAPKTPAQKFEEARDAEAAKAAREYTGFFEKAHAHENIVAGANFGARYVLESAEMQALKKVAAIISTFKTDNLHFNNVIKAANGALAALDKLGELK